VLFVEHLPRGSKFDWESAHPSYSVVFAIRSVLYRHLGSIRWSEVRSKKVELDRSGISDGWKDDALKGHALR